MIKRISATIFALPVIAAILEIPIAFFVVDKLANTQPILAEVLHFFIIAVVSLILLAVWCSNSSLRKEHPTPVNRRINSWFLIVLITAILIAVLGALFQFIYMLDFDKNKGYNYVVLIDNSGSMSSNDPQMERYSALGAFMSNIVDEKDNFASFIFNDDCTNIYELQPINKEMITTHVDSFKQYEAGGGTDAERALRTVAEYLKNKNALTKGRIIMISDGECNIEGAIAMLRNYGLPTDAISVTPAAADSMMNLANQTGGLYINVSEINKLHEALSEAAENVQENNYVLTGERDSYVKNSPLKATLRIIFLTFLLIILKVAQMMIINLKRLFMLFLIFGVVVSALAAVLVELLTQSGGVSVMIARLCMAFIANLSIVTYTKVSKR